MDSRECVERVWRGWAARRGRDPAPFLAVAQGRRSSETVRLVAPDLDAAAEAAALDRMEEVETEGLRAAPGAAGLFAALAESERGIVTSGTRAIASLRLKMSGLPVPAVFVTGDDVRRGKPDPEGYLVAARRLGVGPGACVALEDSPTGIEAARVAGMRVIAVLGTHPAAALARAHARVASLVELRLQRPGTTGAGLDLEYLSDGTGES